MKAICVLFLAICFLPLTLSAQFYLRGVVVDENRIPLPGAVVCSFPDTICTASGVEGVFEIRRRTPPVRIEVSYVGYEKKVLELDVFELPDHFHIRLRPSVSMLGEVLISEDRIDRDAFQPVTVIGQELFEAESAGNFSAALTRLPGINSISLGVGVGKPVIRGLYSNRVVVTDHGVKQESHQWGTDHGLEIDQFRPGAVEVVKGPASLEYGSDGLGGVIKIRPDPVADRNSVYGTVKGIGKSNNNHLGTAVNFGISGNNFFGSANFSRQSFADYRVPADRFVYNTFELPLFNNRLKNTAGNEQAWSATAGFRDDDHILRLTFSDYSLESGIFPGAFGIPRSYALQDDGDDRNIDFPNQRVRHRKLVAQYQHFLEGGRIFEITGGYQYNHRREFSFPEFHAIPDRNPNERMALELALQTLSLDAVFRYSNVFSIGIQSQYQTNDIGGFDYFLPPFEIFRLGIFAHKTFEPAPDWLVKAGLRVDYGHNDSPESGRFVWSPGGQIIDSLISEGEKADFYNFSASIAVLHRPPGRDNIDFSINLGKTFRIPYPVETSANGVHHGTFRHERGLPGLESEHGYQLDLGARFFSKNFTANFTPFFNYFRNYIYLRPSAVFSPLPDAGQLYQYEQHDAVFYGIELEIEYDLAGSLNFYHGLEAVWNHNVNTGLPLPFTPPASVFSSVNWGKLSVMSWLDIELSFSHRFAFAQNRVDRNELSTPSRNIFNTGLEFGLPTVLSGSSLRFQVHNFTDQFYLDHLSRYRPLGIPEQGRNYTLQIVLPFRAFI